MRVEMGLLQMETDHRPDGTRPGDVNTYLDFVRQQSLGREDAFVMTEEQCAEMDREFLQYYHRRICWLALRQFDRAVQDADHTLSLMDFVSAHSPDRQWMLSHEQYRTFVLFQRTQGAALAQLEKIGPEAAIEAIAAGLDGIRAVFRKIDAEDQYKEDELVGQLASLQDWIRQQYHVGRTLVEQLADAVAAEQYELAAQLRDEIARRGAHPLP